jgi:predicted protein tyrosine phosphatase
MHHVCGIDELGQAPLEAADRIVSILAPDAPVPQRLVGMSKPVLFLRFHDAIGREVGAVLPADADIQALLDFDADADVNERLIVHCTAGISRSTAALITLLAQRHSNLDDELFEKLRKLRPKAWPNSRMIEIADRMLERRGTLIAALRRHYVYQTRRYPKIARGMLSLDREIEVPVEVPTSSEGLTDAIKAGLRYDELQGNAHDAQALPGTVMSLAAYLPHGDVMVLEARERLAGDQSKWPGRRVREMIVTLAKRVAWAHGIDE